MGNGQAGAAVGVAADIIRLHHQGLGPAKIAQRVGCTLSEATLALVRAGLKRRAHQTYAHLNAAIMTDPNRADRLLRRFSWERDE